MPKLALIDGDMIAYRCSASCEPTKAKPEREPLDLAIQRADELLWRIVSAVETDEHRIFLSGTENFRYLIYPDYKANRRDVPKPVYLDNVRDLILREWGGEITAGYEADDGIGIAAKGDFVIVAQDKDFLQIVGSHYNPIRLEHTVVDEKDAAFNFFTQMLVGDPSDNVRGVDGIGPVKSKKILNECSIEEMHHKVRGLYRDDERFLRNLRLLRLLREEHELEDILCEIKGTPTTEESSGRDPETSPAAYAQ